MFSFVALIAMVALARAETVLVGEASFTSFVGSVFSEDFESLGNLGPFGVSSSRAQVTEDFGSLQVTLRYDQVRLVG